MITLGQRIRAEREAQRISRAELAKSAGIARTTLSDLELGLSKSSTALHKIARRLGVLPEWLETGRGAKILPQPGNGSLISAQSTGEPPPGYVRFHLMDMAASAGNGAVNEDFPETIRVIDIAEWQVRAQVGFIPKDGRVQLITVRGDSMHPDIENGDVVMVDVTRAFYDGDGIYLINMNGYTFVKRLQMLVDGLHVISSNSKYKTQVIPVDEIESLHICGQIVGAAMLRGSAEL